jgi:4-amino-4-deoxy-L-arabinose transferase-like glycosyltransferase
MVIKTILLGATRFLVALPVVFPKDVVMGLLVPFQPAADEFANHLAAPRPERLRLPSARWLLLLLVMLCLIPRAAMAVRIPSVCPDGVIYIHAAEALEAGDWHAALKDMSLNIYPVILLLLHHIGLGWELAASLWGVLISSLVVLPLWGWVRRQFDDRIALVSCLLYAVHPKFIEWSPEVMRDPTFWFLFTLAIYWLWRAITEVRYGYFIAGGATITLASMTRVEGLFLLIPLALWTFWRFLALQTDRKRLLFGAVLCVVAFPSLLMLANLGWLFSHSGWAALRVSPLTRVQPWLASLTGQSSGSVAPGLPEESLSVGRMLWVFFPTMTRGLSPVFALLMFGGIWRWRRVWSRRDHQPLFYTAVVVTCGIWVQLWYDRYICPRYALPIVLMASPFAALGLLWLIERTLWLGRRLQWSVWRCNALAVAVAAVVAAISLADTLTSNGKYFTTRRMAADLGCWMRREYATPPMIVGPVGITPIIGFYADSPYRMFRCEAGDGAIMRMVKKNHAAVVLLQPARQLTAQRCDAIVARLKDTGLEPVTAGVLPASCNDVYVLVRNEQNPSMGQAKPCPTRR